MVQAGIGHSAGKEEKIKKARMERSCNLNWGDTGVLESA